MNHVRLLEDVGSDLRYAVRQVKHDVDAIPVPGHQRAERLWLFVATCTARRETWLLRVRAEGQ